MVDMERLKREVGGLDTNGKLILFGGAVGVVGCFLEWFGSSMTVNGPISMDFSSSGIDHWRGKLALLGLAAAAGTFAHGTWGSVDGERRALYVKIQLGGAALAVLMTLWFWLAADSASSPGISVGTSFGLWLTLFAALAATCGAFQRFRAAGGPPAS